MTPHSCRVCRHSLPESPLLRYPDMPQAAQYFPSRDTLAHDHQVDLTIVQCNGCGLVQLTNKPVNYYREVIRATAFSEAMRRFRLGQFADFVARYQLYGQKVVEIGCGRGEYLQLLQEQGLDAYGLEQGATAVQNCLQQNLNVQMGYAEGASFVLQDAPFNAVFMFNFLEHMPNPVDSLRGIAANLIDGAVGIIEVPNFDMMLRENQFTEFVTDHLSYFTADTLRFTLQLGGFDVLECCEVWDEYIISATVRKRSSLNIAGLVSAQATLTDQLHSFIDQFPAGQVAVWGAGHQALAVIAMTGIKDKIHYVVDSAPFKQNKLTPATHVPIVSPDQFYQDGLQGLIIMAAAYSDEVAKLVQRHAKPVPEIAILRSGGLELGF